MNEIYETYDAPAEKQAEQDDACCTAPPPEHDYPQSYANQTVLGLVRSPGFDQGFQAAMGERNYQDEQRRSNALHLAIQYTQGGKDASAVVKTAEAFFAFLKGE